MKKHLRKVSKHLKKNNFNSVRFNAFDAKMKVILYLKEIFLKMSIREISKGGLAYFQSHYLLWRHMADNEKKPILILENDASISSLYFKILTNTNWIYSDAKIIKCDGFGNKKQRVLISLAVSSF